MAAMNGLVKGLGIIGIILGLRLVFQAATKTADAAEGGPISVPFDEAPPDEQYDTGYWDSIKEGLPPGVIPAPAPMPPSAKYWGEYWLALSVAGMATIFEAQHHLKAAAAGTEPVPPIDELIADLTARGITLPVGWPEPAVHFVMADQVAIELGTQDGLFGSVTVHTVEGESLPLTLPEGLGGALSAGGTGGGVIVSLGHLGGRKRVASVDVDIRDVQQGGHQVLLYDGALRTVTVPLGPGANAGGSVNVHALWTAA